VQGPDHPRYWLALTDRELAALLNGLVLSSVKTQGWAVTSEAFTRQLAANAKKRHR